MKSVLSKMNNYRKIQASSKAKNARYSTRREPKIMDIESTTCGFVAGQRFVAALYARGVKHVSYIKKFAC